MTADAPPQVRYGHVRGRFVAFQADSADQGQVPDERLLSGSVTLTPAVPLVRWPTTDPPRIAVIDELRCPVIDGELYPPGTTPDTLPDEPGVWITATDQPEGEPDTLQWWATFRLDDTSPNPGPVRFNVPSWHLPGDEIDLALVIPAPPAPAVIHVVTSADRLAAQAAAAAAANSATSAAADASAAAGSATVAGSAAVTADGSAAAAFNSAVAAADSAAAAASSAATAAGIRLFWVPHTEPWPPAPDPNPLHVYIRYWAPT